MYNLIKEVIVYLKDSIYYNDVRIAYRFGGYIIECSYNNKKAVISQNNLFGTSQSVEAGVYSEDGSIETEDLCSIEDVKNFINNFYTGYENYLIEKCKKTGGLSSLDILNQLFLRSKDLEYKKNIINICDNIMKS